jgi:uncharacterized protein YggE
MISAQTRLLVVCGVLIAVAAASVTALAISVSRPTTVSGPPPQVLTLAASASGNTITVVGVGIGSATPNQAQMSLGVTATKPNVRDAVSAASTDMNRLLSALHGQGVQDKDVQTTSIWVSQQTNCCPQTVIGYTASVQVTVTVHSIDKATPLIEAAVDAVGNNLQLNGIGLSVADQSGMLKTARAAAMSDANVKAQDYARLSGHHVGGLVGVSEVVSTTGGFSCDQCGGKGGGGGIQIQPGQTAITVTVAVTYEIAA